MSLLFHLHQRIVKFRKGKSASHWMIPLLMVLFIGCSRQTFKSKWTEEIAPKTFAVRFETTKGNFDIEINREWSPKAADRFFQLVKYNYYDQGIFYRVIPEFVAQFGNSDTIANARWAKFKIPDEQVVLGNEKGTLSFARSGKETRTADLYINLRDNSRLDTLTFYEVKGFPAFGRVTRGMEVVESVYGGYEGRPAENLGSLYSDREKFLIEFPKLDVIRKVYFLKRE